ncbi:SDR family oxidoreductase [Mesoterricola sediminis]|uniref:Short-chain dehydrogenase/reductase n=1 Tax=Mesoterricola sediminis TaxID=2927980 RepID=A0AA48GQ49_9BACT|nr:SDR family oxidoreductase [Mesoterricola sediminis]BDU75522.1 putative short-chain dehydrogenase/reductase [Mesoterricola sediminis]
MTRLQGAHVLITGAASGIGRLMALGARDRGARLTLLDRDGAGLAAVLAELGEGHAGYAVDLADRAATLAAADQVLRERGPVEVLVNNAGIVTGRPILDCSEDAIERTFRVNTLALFWLTRAFLPGMLAQGRGHVVTLASAAGLGGTSRLTDYCASKFAAVGFDESLRLELKRLGHPVRTTLVCPFYIDTGMFAGVRTRFPWLLPILRPEYVARRVLGAVASNRKRLILPRFVLAVLAVKVLPPTLYDAILGFFGVNRTMDEFRGR